VCSGCRDAEDVYDGRYNWCSGRTMKKGFRDDKLDIGDHEAVAELDLAADAAAAGKASEEARSQSSIEEEFRDDKLDIGDHEAVAEPDLASVAAAAGKASEEA
jgi:hypothetical protein